MISIVVAASKNGVIGVDGDLPWRLPDDLRYFKELTTGKPVIMGRKTYESIGRPLPNRLNIVITRDPAFDAPGCNVAPSPGDALRLAGDASEVMVIGGGTIYEAFADSADRIYLTRVHTDIDGDVFFESPDSDRWNQVDSTHHPADERHAHAFEFLTYERRPREQT
ncbi:MAG: dihydrofolate reductase [Woeseiaceae bacterium]|nr:dihydrofolate reductase [Woeseiaceae bacterium]